MAAQQSIRETYPSGQWIAITMMKMMVIFSNDKERQPSRGHTGVMTTFYKKESWLF